MLRLLLLLPGFTLSLYLLLFTKNTWVGIFGRRIRAEKAPKCLVREWMLAKVWQSQKMILTGVGQLHAEE